MNTKNIVRKAVALGSGAALVGTTLMGAFAYDLSTYPAKFVVDGKFDGKIVVGEKAATPDVVGAIDIAASLQSASVSKVPVAGASGTTSYSGDSFRIQSSSENLALREPIATVVDTITESNLKGLSSGKISTSEGSTDYHQYLRFQDNNNMQNMSVNYVENDDRDQADYLVVDTSKPFLEWEIQFPQGLESKVSTDGRLRDMEDKTFNMLGTDFNIVKASTSGLNGEISMTLMGGSVPDTLREGETKTYTIDGVDYEVTLVFVSDPSSGGSTQVKFSVNGEITQALSAGDTYTLSGGTQIGVRDILVNAREGVASFYLGANKIVLEDSSAFTSESNPNLYSGSVEINNQNINDGAVSILASNVSGKVKITSIKYALTMNADKGSIAYVPAGKGLKELMRYPEALISPSLDIKYAGLETVETTDFLVNARSDDRYELTFTNIEGAKYTIPFLSNRDGVFKFGDDRYDFIFVDAGVDKTDIARNDYFVVSNVRDSADKSVTNVLRYEDYDSTQHILRMRDLSNNGNVEVPIQSDGTGSLVIGGHTYPVNVSNISASQPNISVDLDGNGWTSTPAINLTTQGGFIVNLATAINNGTAAVTLARAVDGLGAITNVGTGNATVSMQGKVLAKNFANTIGDETFTWTLRQSTTGSSPSVTMSFGSFVGPRANSANEGTRFVLSDSGSSDHKVGMSDWGIMIDQYSPSSNNNPNELTLKIPKHQVFAQVFATMGSVEATTGGAGTADKVNPIAVGLAVLDTNAPAVGTENMIVVGGPCVNTVAAALMGNPAVCSEGFEAGKATIKAYENNGKVAVLVAGYAAQDTQGASKVLAAYKDYSLKGSEVEVVVADMNSIKVSSVSSK